MCDMMYRSDSLFVCSFFFLLKLLTIDGERGVTRVENWNVSLHELFSRDNIVSDKILFPFQIIHVFRWLFRSCYY